jgi:hypothetical protein
MFSCIPLTAFNWVWSGRFNLPEGGVAINWSGRFNLPEGGVAINSGTLPRYP